MRRVVFAAALVVTGSCGAPTAPAMSTSTTAPAVRQVVLAGGPYSLALTLSRTGLPVCQNGFCTSLSLCIGNPAITTASFNVDVERDGDAATVRVPGGATSMVLSLQVTSASVTGTIAGSAQDANGMLVDVSGAVSGAAPSNAAVAVAGNIDGQMSVAGDGCSNNGHGWSLTPR
jgi:hypothetical protein